MNQKFSKCFLLTAKLVFSIILFVFTATAANSNQLDALTPHKNTEVQEQAARNSSRMSDGDTTGKVATPPSATESGEGRELSPNEMSKLTADEAVGMDYNQAQIDEHFKQLEKEGKSISGFIDEIKGGPSVTEIKQAAKVNSEAIHNKGGESITVLVKKCNESAMGTADHCLESWNPGVQSSMSALGQLAPMIGMMSMNDTCSAFSKIMTALNGAMAAYRMLCASEKMMTESTCNSAMSKVQQVKKEANRIKELAESTTMKAAKAEDAKPLGLGSEMAVKEIIRAQERVINVMSGLADVSNRYTPAYGLKIAAGKAQLLANAGANALQVAGTMMSGQKCDKATGAPTDQADLCKQYPNLCAQQSSTPIADYCTTNPNDITCICSKNMNDPACTGTKSIDPTPGSSGGTAFNPADPNFSLDDSSADLGPGFNPVDPNGLADGGNGTNSYGASGGPDGAGGSYGSSSPGSSSGSRGGVGNLGQVGSGSDGRSGSGNRGSGVGSLGSGLGGSGGSSGAGGAPGNYGTGFNTDIAHDGGSGAAGNFGDGSRKPSTEEMLKAFMPGGEKDPKKGGLDGITAAGGLTIFQKVTRGYQRNAGSLIPE